MIIRNIQQLYTKYKYYNVHRDKNLWVFGEWFGERCCDNAFFLANHIAEYHPEITLCWVVGSHCDTSRLHTRIKLIAIDSDDAVNTLKRAGAIIVVQGLGDVTNSHAYYFGGAVVINLWHGVPWKKIGGDKLKNKAQFLYNKYWVSHFEADYYLSTSREFDTILKRGYYCGEKGLIRSGYPRNSLFYDKCKVEECRSQLMRLLSEKGFSVTGSTKIVTYMPTFRDNTDEVFSFEQIMDNAELLSILSKNNAIIIEKAHFVSNHRLKENTLRQNPHFFRLPEYASQELLAASDVLITDYSSCFYDFLLLDRPIIHYLYDYYYYSQNDRGLYYKKEDVNCGAVAESEEMLISSIEESLRDGSVYHDLRKERKNKYMEYESHSSCEDVFKAVYSCVSDKLA